MKLDYESRLPQPKRRPLVLQIFYLLGGLIAVCFGVFVLLYAMRAMFDG